MRTLFCLIGSFLMFNLSFSQEFTEANIDEQSYNMFVAGKYQETIKLGKEALLQKIDFYYLRYRMGVSYFELKNYEAAINHLEIAKKIDSNDPYLMEYLYYAYTYTNQTEKAYQLTTIFPDDLKVKINHKTPLFKSVSFEIGQLKTSDLDNLKNADLRNGLPFAQGTFFSDVIFSNVLITNQITPYFTLQNNFSYVANSSESTIQRATKSKFEDKNNYYQWSILGTYYLKGYKIGLGAGWYNSNYNLYYFPTPPTPIFGPIVSENFKKYNYSSSISVSKHYKYFEPNICISYSDLGGLKNSSAEIGLTLFPLGNINFYTTSKFGFVSNESNNNSIFTQLFGLKISKKIWLETFGAYGNHQNYISDNGLSVFNTPNKINWYAGSNINIYLKHFDLSFGYGIQERASSYYTMPNLTNYNQINYTYNYNLLKTKIVWKF